MSLRRFEGKSVDEALDNAAEEMGVERYRLSYHVVVEKRGFLGGTKRVVIEAWEDDFGNRIDAPPPAPRPERQKSTGGRGRGNGRSGRGRGKNEQRDRGGRRRRSERGGEDRRDVGTIDVEVGPAPPVSEDETATGKTLREWFERLFELAGIALDARVEEAEERFVVRLYGEDVKRVLAKHGVLLDSLQIIANKTVIV